MQKKKDSRQGGVTLLEMLASLAILGSVMVGAIQLADMYMANSRAVMTAQQMTTVGKAMQAYIKDNYSEIINSATDTAPALITVGMLVNTKYLPDGFQNKNSYGQTICGLVLQPSAESEQLNALLVAENISNAEAINDVDLAQVASTIGPAGGGVYSTSAATITGAMGGWSIEVDDYHQANNQGVRCDGSSGSVTTVQIGVGTPVMALWFAEEKVADVLYRDRVNGKLELNQMNTPIQMNSLQETWRDINCSASVVGSFTIGPAVGSIPSAGVIYPGATTYSVNGSPMSGQLLVCQRIPAVNGASALYRWAPVASPAFWNFSDLPACGNEAPYGQLATVLSSKEPKMETGGRAWNGKVYVCGFDSTTPEVRATTAKYPKWVPVGVDDDGNIMVHGTAGINKLDGLLEIVAPGYIPPPHLNINNCSYYTWNGISSSANGRLARDIDTGELLVCKDNKWVTVATYKQGRTELQVHATNSSSSDYKCPDGWELFSAYLMSDDNGADNNGTQSYPTYERTCLSPVGTSPTVTTLRAVWGYPHCLPPGQGSAFLGRGVIYTALDYYVDQKPNGDYYFQSTNPGFKTYETYCKVSD